MRNHRTDKKRAALLAVLFGLAIPGCGGRGGIPVARMKQQTVLIRVAAHTTAGAAVGSGSGFVISDGRHVVTNHHVCCRPFHDEQGRSLRETVRKIFVHTTGKEFVEATVKWSSSQLDLAILELPEPTGRPPVTFVRDEASFDGQEVYVIGYPGAADLGVDAFSRLTAKLAPGRIAAFVKADGSQGFTAGTRLFQYSSGTNPGNSGGPVFDACGRVLAIHSQGATGSQNIKWGIRSDELLEQLPKLGLSAPVSGTPCAAGAAFPTLWIAVTVLASLSAAGASLFLALTPKGRGYLRSVTRRAPSRPVLKGTGGFYVGTSLEMEDEPWMLGRDRGASDLVFPSDTAGVSRRHCSIRYDAQRRVFLLEDAWSTNGTFLQSGVQLEPGEVRELRAGDRFFLGTPENQFEVALEPGEAR